VENKLHYNRGIPASLEINLPPLPTNGSLTERKIQNVRWQSPEQEKIQRYWQHYKKNKQTTKFL